ncbi:hypothetical protein [Anaeromyxobacter sp. PSR-1]|uniref:hypothetical protein n=1 Tax=Anaeromyxobacter sp. PSR-1 TaxID=1300915 RepID=UPI0005E8DBB3|nr:hypothetical protein [Anaeromyxobacter sp. PSR-1]GAO01951.1 hypothetical protein PSR1_00816 [Anaeromyxobacter sp. PSR-1]
MGDVVAFITKFGLTARDYRRLRRPGMPANPDRIYPAWSNWPTRRNRCPEALRAGYCHDGEDAVKDGLCPTCDRQVREIVADTLAQA